MFSFPCSPLVCFLSYVRIYLGSLLYDNCIRFNCRSNLMAEMVQTLCELDIVENSRKSLIWVRFLQVLHIQLYLIHFELNAEKKLWHHRQTFFWREIKLLNCKSGELNKFFFHNHFATGRKHICFNLLKMSPLLLKKEASEVARKYSLI